MNAKRLVLLATVAFSIAVLGMYDFVTQPALAVTFHDTTVGADAVAVDYITSTNNYVVLRTTSDAEAVDKVSATSFIRTTGALSQDLGAGAYISGIDCMTSSDRCAVIFDGVSDYVRVVSSSGSTLGTETIVTRIAGEDDVYVSGGNLYYPVSCSGADSDRIVMVWSITGAPSLSGEIGDCSGTNWGNNGFLQLKVYNTKLITATQGAGNQFQIWNTGGGRVCTASVAVDTFDYSSSNNRYYISTGSGTVQQYDGTCSDVGDITAGQHGQSGTIRNIVVNEARDELYIVGTGSVSVMNLTSVTQLLQTIPIAGDSGAGSRYKFIAGSNVEQVANLVGTTLAIRELDPSIGVTPEEVCIQITGSNQQVCYTDTDGDGLADAGSALEVVSNQNPPARAVGRGLCQLGVIEDCTDGTPTDTDVTTNGTGLLMYFGLLAVLMAIIGGALYGKVKVEYNLMLQIPVLLISTGLAVAFGWIESMWLYIMIFVVIGFASLAGSTFIMGKVKGRQS